MSMLSWAELPSESLLNIFSYFDVEQLIKCSTVNKHWNNCYQANENWKSLCSKDWLISERGEDTYYNIYKNQFKKFGRYRHCYAKVRGLWNRLEHWLKENSPTIFETLNPGATEDQLKEFQQETGITFDDEIALSFMIHNGQTSGNPRAGLFGGYKFYDFHVNLHLSTLSKLSHFKKAISDSKNAPDWIRESVPVVTSYNGWKHFFYSLSDNVTGPKKGSIIEPTQNLQGTFLVASSFYDLLRLHTESLERGNYEASRKYQEIIRYPLVDGVSVATSHGITVTCSPLFVPERSIMHVPTFFYAYRIRLTVDKNRTEVAPCKLTMRHWIITDGAGKIDRVNGEGVIGKYPEMFPGAHFEYASCCPLSTPTGNMQGLFEFKVRETQEIIQVNVPLFVFKAPDLLAS